MNVFRFFLSAVFLGLLSYTAIVSSNHGMNLLPIFLGDMAKMEWPGQFNLDFVFMLTFSALWVSWRHRFSPAGIALGIVAFFGGSLFLSAYLFVESLRVGGDPGQLALRRAE
jgi:hypothetical protein